MKFKKLSIGFVLLITQTAYGQVGINTQTPQAMLDIVSTTRGILIPRLTAAEIEQINTPSEGVLVFSTTNTGSTINTVGFWYYNSSTWLPIIATNASGGNIYTNNGNLSTNRIVTMNNFNFNVGPDKLFLSGSTTGNVGVMTDSPTQKLDINGGMRIRSLPTGNVITDSDGVLTINDNLVYKFGDIRYSAVKADHNGWYLLDGRALSSLPAGAQAQAAALGITGILPNSTNKYIKQGTPGIQTGINSVTIVKGNMPIFTLTGNTTAIYHNHNLSSPGYNTIKGTNLFQDANGGANTWQLAGGYGAGSVNSSQTYTSSTDGNHSHNINIPTGGNDTPVSLTPAYIQLNYFIYLGN